MRRKKAGVFSQKKKGNYRGVCRVPGPKGALLSNSEKPKKICGRWI